jgi:hypothetical protein
MMIISNNSLHLTVITANAIHDGAILLGRRSTVGRFQTATGQRGYALLPTHNTERNFAESFDAAAAFIALEGDYNASCALDRALDS